MGYQSPEPSYRNTILIYLVWLNLRAQPSLIKSSHREIVYLTPCDTHVALTSCEAAHDKNVRNVCNAQMLSLATVKGGRWIHLFLLFRLTAVSTG